MEEANSAVRGEQLIAEVLLLMYAVCFTCSLSLSVIRYEYSFGQAYVPFCPRLQLLFWKLHSIKHLSMPFFIFCCPGSGCSNSSLPSQPSVRGKEVGPAVLA